MRRSLFFSLFFLSLFSSVSAQEETIDSLWNNDLKVCFERSVVFEPKQVGETIKVLLSPSVPLPLFLQDNTPLPFKIFSRGQEKYESYTIVRISGEEEDSASKQVFFSDNNRETSFSFDPYSSVQKSIELDMRRLVLAHSLHFQLYTSGNMIPYFLVSKDGKNFIPVRRIEEVDFRFLRIIFEPFSKKKKEKEPFSVQDISFFSPEKDTYLLTPKTKNSIHIYDGYHCQEKEVLQKLQRLLKKKSQKTNYVLSAKTPEYDIDFQKNTAYNTDFDGDSFDNNSDNCPFVANPDQKDGDGDLRGDVCDFDLQRKNFFDQDSDGDGVGNSLDNCPYVSNAFQLDSNADGRGDLCSDDDRDGVRGDRDNCPLLSNSDQKDININGVGDACEFDYDEDGVFDEIDNCRSLSNPDQKDEDNDGVGDACDNCRFFNARQIDANEDGVGDVCEEWEEYQRTHDDDNDGVLNSKDNCSEILNSQQEDKDKDGVGDACDNCPSLQNPVQQDDNENGVGDMCEDSDQDGVEGYRDNCPTISNADQKDQDNDGRGDLCEDDDRDGIFFVDDNCPFVSNMQQGDIDDDGVGDKCDDRDDRFLESNKGVIIALIILLTLVFSALIFWLVQKMRKQM